VVVCASFRLAPGAPAADLAMSLRFRIGVGRATFCECAFKAGFDPSIVCCIVRDPERLRLESGSLSRDNLDENGATIWIRRGDRAGLIIDAGRRLGKA